MPASNPRITITLKPEVHALLRELARLADRSQSALVGELLEQSVPVFERMVSLLGAAERLKAESTKPLAELRESLAVAQGRIEAQLGLALHDFDEGSAPLLSQAELVSRRRGRSGRRQPHGPSSAAGSTPVPVTRGSGGSSEGKVAGKKRVARHG